MKKLNSLQHFVNNIWFKKTWTNCSIIKTVVCPGFFESDVISTDSQSPVIKFFKTGLIYAYIYWPISKFNQQSNFFQPKNRFFLKKLVLGSDGNWLFWTHSWSRLWMICRPSGRSFQLLTCAVCTRAWAEKEVCNTFIRTNIPEIPVWGFKIITFYFKSLICCLARVKFQFSCFYWIR